jgi:hypothetical protein
LTITLKDAGEMPTSAHGGVCGTAGAAKIATTTKPHT